MDSYLFELINNLAGQWRWLDFTGVFLADYLGYFLIAALLLMFFLRFSKFWRSVLGALLSALLARLVFTNIVYWIWARPRPFEATEANLLLEAPGNASFPSGHAAFYFAIAFFLFYRNKNAGALFFTGALLMGLARVFVGIHWPLDILGGIFVAGVSALLVKKLIIRRV